MEPKYPKLVVKLAPGLERHMISASVCRVLAKANVNGMIIANFSNLAANQQSIEALIAYCEQWVTVTGKEHYGQTAEAAQTAEPNISSTT